MNNASPRPFPSFPSRAVPGGGLAPINVIDVDIGDDDSPRDGAVVAAPDKQALHGRSLPAGSFTSPFSHAENIAGDDVAGFFIGLVIALGAGLLTWAAFVAAFIFFSK